MLSVGYRYRYPVAAFAALLLAGPPFATPLLGGEGEGRAAAEEPISFARDIQPILSDNCYFCHGPDANHREAGLRLDREEEAAAVVEPRDSAASELLRRIRSDDPSEIMPPPESNRSLSADEIELLRRWIDEGAEWGLHWSFAPLEKPALPAANTVNAADTVDAADSRGANPVDVLVAAKLNERGWQLAPEASRETLVRRVTLDLTGLPPTPAEVEAFLSDRDPHAYEKLVDRLLQSPAYGERMAWDWLDAARYADSNGYQGDQERTMWPWRDWVVRAFNQNLPYDQFTIWQLAGDLLPEATFDQRLATGFCRNHMINGEGGRIPEENRVDYVMDMTETVGTVWLGLTVNCCRCHDHKFDPLSHRDYYSLFAFFNQTPVDGSGGNPQTPPVLAAPTPEQQRAIAAAEHEVSADDASTPSRTAESQERLKELRAEVAKVMVMADAPEPRPTFVLRRGLYNDPGEEVTAEVPSLLPPLADGAPHNRLGLAQWLVSPDNPLTARVTVNRFWQQLFGIGLVKTVEDFGVQGEIPLHADLLDWLAADFREKGWDVKALLRRIVTSKTYRQSSEMRFAEADPENRWLARGPRFRMPSWMLRDQALAASGLLDSAQGGRPVNGYQPAGVWEEATFGKKVYRQDSGAALYRRSLYTFWRRIIAPTMFFDNASRQTCTIQVLRTNTPLHALLTLNDVTYIEAARALAQRALTEPVSTEPVSTEPVSTEPMPDSGSTSAADAERIDFVFARLLARSASEAERKVLLAGLHRSRGEFAAAPNAAESLLAMGDSPRDPALAAVEHAAWTALCLAVLNLDETLTKE